MWRKPRTRLVETQITRACRGHTPYGCRLRLLFVIGNDLSVARKGMMASVMDQAEVKQKCLSENELASFCEAKKYLSDRHYCFYRLITVFDVVD